MGRRKKMNYIRFDFLYVLAIPGMSSTSNRVISNIRDSQAQQNFADAMRELLEGVREVRYSLDGDRAASEEPIVVRKKVIAGRGKTIDR